MRNTLKLIRLTFSSLLLVLIYVTPSFSQGKSESTNILLNPAFDFHSFINHREGKVVSFSSHNLAFWNTDT